MSAAPDRRPPPPPSLTDVLHALADPTRLAIVGQLADGREVACGAFDLDAPKSSLSHHFAVLIGAGVIARRKHGPARLNRLRWAELNRAFPGLLDAVLNARAVVRRPDQCRK